MNLPQLEPCAHELPAHEFGTSSQLIADAGHGDDPIIVMLTCWELGGDPDQISFAKPGEVMVAQNPGGVVPPADTHEPGSSLDTVRYCLTRPTVRHMIVCGHTECKMLCLLLQEETDENPNPFRDLMESVKERFQTVYFDRPTRDWLEIVVQESVLQQLSNLRSHDDIRERLEAGELLLHGWVRNDETSAITSYNPATGQFTD